MSSVHIQAGGTYEMLWDCEYCATSKLLGLSQRFCPHCGAPQNPDKRYFPADEDKVEASAHRYSGADQICAACSTPNSAKSDYCTQCGAPLSGSASAPRQADELKAPGTHAFVRAETHSTAPKKRRWALIVIIALITMAVLAVALLWKKEQTVHLQELSWERHITIESFGSVAESGWCDSMPGEVYDVRRESKVRSQRHVEDGEVCSLRRIDQGDGSYQEQQECRPKYRNEPVYDDYCHYSRNRWAAQRTLSAAGTDKQPYWPQVTLNQNGACIGCLSGACLGCEREGSRREKFYFHLHDAKGQNYKCTVALSVWQNAQINTIWRMEKRVLSSGCGDLSRVD
jgi:hypothetical protein